MKTSKGLMAIAVAALSFVACQKDFENNSGKLILVAEGMNGTKLAIDGNASHWATGDDVWINNHTYTVDLSESGQATVDVEEDNIEAPLYGVYPASIYSSNSGNNYTIDIPSSYTYTTCTDGGYTRQNLQSPMMAYAVDGNKLVFKHLTAAVTVEITNDFGIDLQITSITVSSNLYKLNGSRTFDITNIVHDATAADTALAATDGEKTVTMNCNSTPLIVVSGQTKQVQVPVLPVGLRNKFTITVNAKNPDDGDMTYTFTKTQASSGHALLRAQLGYAPAKFGGKFSIGNDEYVRFAPGNLQYQASTGNWRFAKHQYDAIGDANSSIAYNYSGWIDLIGFGTSGWNGGGQTAYQPYATSTTNTEYINQDLSGVYANADWGWYNSISNGGNAINMWRTPSQSEWTNIKANNNWYKATVNSVPGLIITPYDYSHPLNGSLNSGNMELAQYSNNVISDVDWAKMEVAGAIFLPVTGWRGGNGVYRTSTDAEGYYRGYYWAMNNCDSGRAYSVQISADANWSYVLITVDDKFAGFAVRLIRAD